MATAHRFANLLMAGAWRLIPADKEDWARAMAAEQASIGEGRQALAFSAGCARAAATERLRNLAPDGAWFWPGLAFGTLLLATAGIPGSRSFPLLWAPVAGVVTVLGLQNGDSALRLSRAVFLAFCAGLLSALIFLAGGLLLCAAAGAGSAPLVHNLNIPIALTILTTISGAAVAPLVCTRPGAGAPSMEKEQ